MHLADAFIQSDLVHSGYICFCQYMCSLGIEPTTFVLLQYKYKLSSDELYLSHTSMSIMRSEMCSLHLTHPSGAVGSRRCGARGAVWGSVPCSRAPQSWTLPARAGIRTHNFGLPQVLSPTLYPLGHDCPSCAANAMLYH